jgi:tRNA nucleotidyltransferase (CCA-adding enzyme)
VFPRPQKVADTWLSGEPDIDVFMRVPKDVSRDRLAKTCLEIARKATEGSMQIERFADHPYLEAFVDDVRVNVVPCYDVRRGDWLSATDRTPYHTDYVKKHLTGEMHSDVRLLKKFMKGVGVYGAEIKIGGFSGYLCELLVLNYGSFVSVLKAFAGHKQPVTVDIEGHFKGRENEFALLFPETLIVVDPIDKGRNVASAVQRDRLYSFVAAARQFLKEPAIEFFFPPRIKPMTANKLKERLEKSDSSIVFVTFRNTQSVPDILWGQLYKSQRSLRKLLALNDFVILRDLPWSDEKTLSFFVFELEQRCIPSVKKHLGPPIEREKECESFVEKHRNNASTVEGPFVEDGRWAVILRRRCVDAVELLKDRLRNGGKDAGVAEGLSGVIRDGFSVLVNADIIDIYNGNRDFSLFLTDFLSGKPKWLESHQSQDD